MKYLMLLTILAFVISCSNPSTKKDHNDPDYDSSDLEEPADNDTPADEDVQNDDIIDPDVVQNDEDIQTDEDIQADEDVQADDDLLTDEDNEYEIIEVDNDPSPLSTSSLSYNGMNASVTLNSEGYRTYELSTDITLRDNNPSSKSVVIVEE
ncbi:MAG TPA: hypothetical protein P5044_10795, partial [bacterium]|nr:hypothetical protein [bacterium]